MSESLEKLPRTLIAGVIAVVMGFVSIVIGIVLFGSTAGIGAYMDTIFAGMGVQANITKTMQAFQFNTVFNFMGIAIMMVGFVLIILALLSVAKESRSLWRE
jgi:hypothetical protein